MKLLQTMFTTASSSSTLNLKPTALILILLMNWQIRSSRIWWSRKATLRRRLTKHFIRVDLRSTLHRIRKFRRSVMMKWIIWTIIRLRRKYRFPIVYLSALPTVPYRITVNRRCFPIISLPTRVFRSTLTPKKRQLLQLNSTKRTSWKTVIRS